MNTFVLRNPINLKNCIAFIQSLALDEKKPFQVDVKLFVKKRNSSQNRYAWGVLLEDFKQQGWIDGKQFSVETWHHFLKQEFLPSEYDPELTLPGYQKYTEMPDGGMRLTGSTTKLTEKGFSEYVTRCMAFGSQELGIYFKEVKK